MSDSASALVLFLDDGGVISDNRVRAGQWQRLVGEFMAPILGGEPQVWAEANRVYITSVFEPAAWQARLAAARDFRDFKETEQLDWVAGMCKLAGIPPPPKEESLVLARRASEWLIPQVRADAPGAVDAIHLLHERGYLLHTASGESSGELEGYLGAIGVRDCFQRLYGGDLVNTLKAGPIFYERIFADAGVSPAHALVVDDSPAMIACASQAGAHTVLVGSQPLRVPRFLGNVRGLAELPGLLDSLQSYDGGAGA